MKKYLIILFLFIVSSASLFSQEEVIKWKYLEAKKKEFTEITKESFKLKIQDMPKLEKIKLNDNDVDGGQVYKGIEMSNLIVIDGNITTIDIYELLKKTDFIKPNKTKNFIIKLVPDTKEMIPKEIEYIDKISDKDKGKINENIPPSKKQEKINRYVKETYGLFAKHYIDKKNNIILAGKTVHVFIDENKKNYFTGFPTTAREDFNYTFHFFYYDDGNENYQATFEGMYEPTFEVYGSNFSGNIQREGPTTSGTNEHGEEKQKQLVKEILFEKVGPYTSSFSVKIEKKEKDSIPYYIINKLINVAKTHHITLTAGLISSFLSNPSDFEKYPLNNGDTTVIANDPTNRGMMTIMATFYPKPRNMLFPATNWKEKIGFVVGTRVDKDFNENFFGGISYDFARGLSLSAGAHYGRVNKLIYDGEFELGVTPYSGELKSKKEWQLGYYIGVNIDLRVFGLLFNP